MSEFTENNPNLSEFEYNPNYQEHLLAGVKHKILQKKFGKSFYDEHDRLTIRKALENEEGQVPKDTGFEELADAFSKAQPLVPEIEELELQLDDLNSLEELLNFAAKEGISLSNEELQEQKEAAIECVRIDNKGTT